MSTKDLHDHDLDRAAAIGRMENSLDPNTPDLITTEDARDHMRGTLELIAGTECFETKIARLGKDADGTVRTLYMPEHHVRGSYRRGKARFTPETCPVCMARKCLAQIDEAESREGGLL